MTTSMDGKITGSFLEQDTMQESFPGPGAPDFAHRQVLAAPGGAMWVRQWK